MAPLLTGIVPTSELEAVNTMLSAIGEAPVVQSQIDTPTAADLVMAITILRNTTREILSMGWRFNTEFGYEIAPTMQYTWTDRSGTSTPLSLFVAPAGLAKFGITRSQTQIGSRWVDVALRTGTVAAAPSIVDPMSDTAGTLFSNHKTPTGIAYTVLTSNVVSDPTHAVCGASGVLFDNNETMFRLEAALPSADYAVQVDASSPVAGIGQLELWLRQTPGILSPEGYVLGWGDGVLNIGHMSAAGVYTSFFSGTSAVQVEGSTHTIKFSVAGNLLKAFIDGVQVASVADAGNLATAAGMAAFDAFGGSTGVDQILLSNFTVSFTGVTGSLFYDRANNRFGLDTATHPYLYIDPVWFQDFTDLPECARRYIAIRAARQLTQQAVGAQELAGFTEKDELYALRVLKREEGNEDDHCNMFDNNMDTAAFLGNRTRANTGVLDPRATPGGSATQVSQ